jgi:hypothetical protein
VCHTVKPVGEPDAGNPHVRFDERGLGNGTTSESLPRPPSTLLKRMVVSRWQSGEEWESGVRMKSICSPPTAFCLLPTAYCLLRS